MKIKLNHDIPLASHNLLKDTVHETVECPEEHLNLKGQGVWVIGDLKRGIVEPVRLLSHEYEVIKEI